MKKVHFIGIGGIGVSALARHYLSEGWTVSGSDQSDSQLIQDLISEGINVKVGPQVAENIPAGVNKIIYTVAVKDDNLEFVRAKELQTSNDVVLMTYPQALGEMTRTKKTIAVCGTHGKTTTTAMTYEMLKECGVDASMIVGSLIEHGGKKTNYVKGASEWIVIEACEYRQSFLNYFPDYTIITNIDADHLDFYKDLEDIKKSFGQFVDNIKPGGKVVVHKQEEYINEYVKVAKPLIIADEANVDKIVLSVPGQHNRQNANLVFELGKELGFSEVKVLQGLKNFKGTWRRQEYKGVLKTESGNEIVFYDDYAHHPHEIQATLAAFREKYSDKKIALAFMPHLFSRTKLLFDGFVGELSKADRVFLMPIYKAREQFDESINSEMIAREIDSFTPIAEIYNQKEGIFEKAKSVQNFEELKNEIINLKDDYIVITMGAGNIDDLYKILNLKK
jgi:UDP-N-acetylmuramate--alanine ligase